MVQLFGSVTGKQDPAKTLLPLLGINTSFQIRKICPKADQLPGLLGTEALSASQITYGFQKIGLTLGIVTHNQIYLAVKGKICFPIIAVIPQRKAVKLHGW